jgi:hypothetical protein
MKRPLMAMEEIAFQNGEFFNALVVVIKELVGFGKDLNSKEYYTSDKINAISKVINKYTNLHVEFYDGTPAANLIKVSDRDILISNKIKEFSHLYKEMDLFSDVRKITQIMGKKIMDGSVDLNKSKVYGIYEKITTSIRYPRQWFYYDTYMLPEESAALILHEVGHLFTHLEFTSRVVTTNQVLAGMVRALDKTVPDENRKAVFARGIELLKLNEEQQQALFRTKNKEMVACIVLDASIKQSVSELGCSVYDSVSCEQLADQFATRHGAGRYIVTSLDKYIKLDGEGPYAKSNPIFTFCKFLGLTAITGGVYVLYSLILFSFNIANVSRFGKTYDSDKNRFIRVKLQNIERLKDKNISNEEKKSLIEDNIIIDDVVSLYNDNLTFIEKIASYLRVDFRNSYKYERLQQELELLASNDLFTSAAKLSTI